MAAVIKHLLDEWERHPDMFAFEITSSEPVSAALRTAQLASERFSFPCPHVSQTVRKWQKSFCVGSTTPGDKYPTYITMRVGFTAGEFLHELAHSWCFWRYGDHDHGSLFRSAMDDLCYWFRLEEEAQAAFFP